MILPKQASELERLLGKFDLIIINKIVPSAEWLIKNYVVPNKDKYSRIIVIPVLPLSIIKKLCEYKDQYGYEIWWSEMVAVKQLDETPIPTLHYDPACEVPVPSHDGDRTIYRIMRFNKFYRLKDIRVELEEIQ